MVLVFEDLRKQETLAYMFVKGSLCLFLVQLERDNKIGSEIA